MISRSCLFAAVVLAFPLSGCESMRSFFQMSSDSPAPFFGAEFTLPPKLSFRSNDADADETATFAEVAAANELLLPVEPTARSLPDPGGDNVGSRSSTELPPVLTAVSESTPPAF